MFSVVRVVLLEPPLGRDVGRGRAEAVPGTPLETAAPVLSSVRCEVTMTLRAGSKISSLNSWDNNHTPSGNLGYTPLPVTHSNRFGAAMGGQIIPKNLLGGKWYGFFNYEGFRFPQSAIYKATVPTATLRAGVIFINQGSAGYVDRESVG